MGQGAELELTERFLRSLKRKDLLTLSVFAKGAVFWEWSGGERAFHREGVGFCGKAPKSSAGKVWQACFC